MGDVVGGLVLDAPAPAHGEPPAEPRAPRDTPATRWRFWRSPPDQPGWARPALLLVAALAALSYSWGSGSAMLETFYGAAVRSMSQSWHDFFFGAFDPWGTVSVDKLPGSFWVQALFVRLFGFHIWAVVLPQAIEGTLTVLVLFRAVRRVAGAGAGLVAAVALAATPVTILLNRGNISDSLLILLLVLAADATTAAVMTGRLRSLVLAGVWVGLAFQAKMLQAWIVLPALYLAYILAAPVRQPGTAGRAGGPLRPHRARRLAELDVCRQSRPGTRPPLRRRQLQQLRLQPGVPLQRRRSREREPARPAGLQPAARRPGDVSQRRRSDPCSRKGPGRFLAGGFGRDAAWLFVPCAGGVGRDLGGPPAPAPHRPLASRRAAVGRLAVPDLELLLLLALPQRVLPGRAGTADGRPLRAGFRAGVAACASGPGPCPWS